MSTEHINTVVLRKFALSSGIILVLLFGVLLPWIFDSTFPLWPWYLAGILIGTAVIAPRILKPVYIGWMKFGMLAGWINSRIILTILFYLVVFPIGLILKILGKDAMHRKIDPKLKSYRIPSDSQPQSQLENPF